LVAEPVDLLIKNGLVVTMNPEREIFRQSDIAVSAGRIAAIAPDIDLPAKAVIQARDHAVLPGLVNAHMHETLTRGACEDLTLDRWLVEVCFPLDRSYTHEIMRAAAMMCQAEMILGGTTTFSDTLTVVCSPIQATLALEGTTALLNWTGGGLPYRIQRATDLIAADWTDVLSNATPPVILLPTSPVGFYRIVGQ